MAAFKVPLKIDQGATFDKVVTWKPNGVPSDLTGCTARAQFRADIESSTVLLELTSANGRIVLGGVAGTIQLAISAPDTTLLTWTEGVYDLELTFADGITVRRLMSGSVTVSREVTRD